MRITRKSVISGIERTRDIPVNPEDMIKWQSGMGCIQDLMPYLNDVDLDFILSGITQDEWSKAFKEMADDL
jgi:hypothetical protein